MGTLGLCRVPQAAVRHGRDRQSSGAGPCGDCRKILWVLGPRGQYSGKVHFIEKSGVQDWGGRHMPKRSSDPRVAICLNVVLTRGYPTPKSKFRYGT